MKSSFRSFLMMIMVVGMAFILRLSLISKGPYSVDTLNLVIQSQQTLETLRPHYLYGSGYPLMVILGALFIFLLKIFHVNDPVFAVNLVSVVFSTLCILFFYKLIKNILSEAVAVYSSIILAVCPIFLDISIYGMSHAPALFFILAGFNSLVDFKQSSKFSTLLRAGILFGLCALTRLQDIVVMLPAISYFVFFNVDRSWPPSSFQTKIRHLAALLFTIFVVSFLGYGLLILCNLDSYFIQFVDYLHSEGNGFRTDLQESLLINYIFLKNNFTLLGLLIFVIGLFLLWRSNFPLALWILFWFMIPLFFFGQLLGTASRFFTIFIPAMIVCQGYLLDRFAKINKFFFIVSFLSFMLILFIPLDKTLPRFERRHLWTMLPDYVQWVSSKTEENSNIVVSDEGLFFDYYTKRRTFRKPPLDQKGISKFKIQVDHLLNQGTPVYMTCLGSNAGDFDGQFRYFLNNHYKIRNIGSRPYESWHLSPFMNHVFECKLIELEKKSD